MTSRPATLGQLRESGWESHPVKEEVRRNAVTRIAEGRPLVDGVLGYEDTVLPQLENALLAGHDVIFLGERGQAKTRIIRSLVGLLDEWMPIVAGSEINDDPYHPVSRHARELVAERGEDTPIEWVGRDQRFGEKLATPDTSIADLIGEVDPIRVAEGRYLSDELTLHYGLVPRTNRGIFSINELPDLAERIQVGLLNVLEERDVQIRGYKIRLPLDVMLVASANPEDYTNRGRIITPLKDRFGAQIRTHYPLDVDTELEVVRQESNPLQAVGLRVQVPEFMAEVVGTLTHLARASSKINQRSGVSVRLSIANYETLVANAARRALRAGEPDVVPRVSDLEALASSTAGKVEIETLEEGRDEHVIEQLLKQAVLTVFKSRCPMDKFRDVVLAFDEGTVVHAGDDVGSTQYVDALAGMPVLKAPVMDLAGSETPAAVASAMEFVLEGLHLSKRLNKEAVGGRATYRGRGVSRFQYSRWDGTQVGFELDADDVLAEITDDLLYHGDLNAALRRMMQSGFRDRNGERVQGMRQLMEQLRKRRREELERYDLGGVYDDIAQELRDVIDTERAGIDQLVEEARQSGDQRRQEVTEGVAEERRMELDMVPPDLAGQVRALQDYEFTSSEARERFDALMEKLRQQLLQSYFNQMSGAMQSTTPEDMQAMKDMFNALNRMLEQREAGEPLDPSFEQFMDQFGQFFPGNPENLDELLEQLAEQMAAMQSLLNSMTPEQRAQLQGLANQLLEDLDLRWQVDRLANNLRSAFPQAGWDRRYNFSGSDPLGFAEAASLMNELGDLDQLENLLRSATTPGALADVDLDRARELLGDDAARSLDRLSELAKMLEEAGLIEQREGRLELTPRGMRRIGQNALSDLFTKLARDRLGRHQADPTGVGHERAYETKPYEFGDPFNLNIERTVRNALQRTGGGVPVRLSPDDFEVERTETITRAATVLMVDLSLSMPMRDNFLAAKKVAMALHSLISSQFPRDYLGIVGFSEVARELKPEQLPEVSWDFVYGTNMQHAFALSRRMLARQSGTKQIIMITDGEPTAHLMADGEVFFHYPPVQETVDATLTEVSRCTRDGIRINTFMLDATGYLKDFVEKLTRLNQGRAFFTTPETLGDYVLVDFIEQRRAMRQSRRTA